MIKRDFCLALLASICIVTVARGEFPAAVIKSAKKATALAIVETGKGTASGSAFCVDDSGVFATNAHVVKLAAEGSTIKLILEPGEETQREVEAKLLMRDEGLDLALLQTTKIDGLEALSLGDATDLSETMEITAVGYPFGKGLSLEAGNVPSPSVNVGRITSLRRKSGMLELVQIDALLNPGNSGGPLINPRGEVVGIVMGGVPGAGINFAIPVNRLRKLMDTPTLTLLTSTLPGEELAKKQSIQVQIISLPAVREGAKLELTIGTSSKEHRTFDADAEKGLVSFQVVPLETSEQSQELLIDATYSQGSVRGKVSDKSIKIGERSFKLSQIASLSNKDGAARLQLVSGGEHSGKLSGDDLVVSLGDAKVNLNLSKAQEVQIQPPSLQSLEILYRLRMKRGDTVLAESKGKFEISSTAPTAAVASAGGRQASFSSGGTEAANLVLPKDVKLEGDRVTRQLPGPVDRVVAGAGGQYLLMHMKKLRKIAVFDVSQGKVTNFISLGSDDIAFAASSKKLLVIQRDEGIVARYDLATLKKELAAPIPGKASIKDIAMGHASDGPAMVISGDHPSRGGPQFIDPQTLKVLEFSNMTGTGHWFGYEMHLRAAANGSAFAGASIGTSPSGIRLLKVQGKSLTAAYEHNSAGVLCPSYDGNLLFTSTGVFSADLKPIAAQQFRHITCIPSYHPAYFVGFGGGDVGYYDPTRTKSPTFYVFSSGDRKQLLSLNDFEEFKPTGDRDGPASNEERMLTLDQKIHFYPTANLLVTIGNNRDSLVLRKLDIVKAMDEKGLDYLFVASLPPASVPARGSLNYNLEVRSKRGSVKYNLDSGPDKMTVSPDGKVRWEVPPGHPSGPVSVIISVADASGQEIYHTFNLQVGP